MSGQPSRRGESDGFILVAVLAVMALLAGLVGAVSLVSRSTVEGARIGADRLTSDALLRAGVELAAHQLYALNLPPASVDTQQIRLDAGTVTLFVASEAGRVDLNGADPALLAGVWRATGLSGMSADAFGARVADWRDEDGDVTDFGGEFDAYRSAGLGHAPRNDAFRSVDELVWVLGVTPADLKVLAPFLTVHNPEGAVNLFDAPEQVLLALPGVAAAGVNRVLSIRRGRTKEAADEMTELFDEQADYVTTEPGAAHRVRIEARRLDGHVASAETVLVKGVTDDALYHVVAWTE